MEPLRQHRRQGAIIHVWGPFRVRAPMAVVTEGYPNRVMPWHMVSIMLGPDGEASEQQEQTLGTLSNADVTLPGLVKMLHSKLRSLEYAAEVMDRHLREMEQPEQMADLQAALDVETREREHNVEAQGKTMEMDRWEWTTTAEEVLANQRDDLRRVQTLYKAVQVGLRDLEEEFPELGTDSS